MCIQTYICLRMFMSRKTHNKLRNFGRFPNISYNFLFLLLLLKWTNHRTESPGSRFHKRTPSLSFVAVPNTIFQPCRPNRPGAPAFTEPRVAISSSPRKALHDQGVCPRRCSARAACRISRRRVNLHLLWTSISDKAHHQWPPTGRWPCSAAFYQTAVLATVAAAPRRKSTTWLPLRGVCQKGENRHCGHNVICSLYIDCGFCLSVCKHITCNRIIVLNLCEEVSLRSERRLRSLR